ncbi:leucyl aminopeptidase [Desmospora profundinema]|uniref:Probable cytosol aminopeptidase n=1 Tax=Desmospora profundinema TaxID=1571184 RepID=A0ABU1IJC9_9BACL|nr:leucyl aminopeptidase [Desmospora profundinema]MDR6224858.1 leucyl aminopeptidase [Desmospora profundinema]
MEWRITKEPLDKLAVDGVVVVHTQEEESLKGCTRVLDEALDYRLSQLVSEGEITGKYREVTLVHNWGKIPSKRLLVLGLGKEEDLDLDWWRNGMALAAKKAQEAGVKQLAIGCFPPHLKGHTSTNHSLTPERFNSADWVQAVVEGIELGTYRYHGYKTEEQGNKNAIETVWLAMEGVSESALEAGVERGGAFAAATKTARDLANDPANILTPSTLAMRAREMAEKYSLEIDILDEDRLTELGMDALLSVARASEEPAQMIVLTHQGAPESEKVLGLVGKGITFDSGGIQVKPGRGMEEMKGDMAGAAAVFGAMEAIGRLKPHCNVTAVIPACENMINGNGYRPGDVIGSFSGKTIEIQHTDAEGRLVLADGISYARRLGATSLVDVATLTGAVIVALGHTTTGLMTNNDEWAGQVKEAARLAGEKMWELPLYPEYGEYLKSAVADLKNEGGAPAGSIQGGMFLKVFAEETPWVHLDIAGTADSKKEDGIRSKGATGVAVRTLAQLAVGFGK